jgi:diguanylate cyclase (GGDEF)-like protein
VDNPIQQRALDRAVRLGDGERTTLGALLADMQAEEDRLMTVRTGRFSRARSESSIAFVAGALLTLAFGVGAFVFLRAQRQELNRQRVLLQTILESVDEGVIALDPSRKIIAINAAARGLWGSAPPGEHWPMDWRPALTATYEDGSSMKPEDGPLARALRGETSKDVVYRVAPKGDPERGVWISASARPLSDGRGTALGAVTTLRDISAHRAAAESLRDQSLTDELTGLLNRRGFLTAAQARIAEARAAKAPVALLYADVNGLKRINDELGHERGDGVIVDAARALESVFRAGDTVARMGGDEFVALLTDCSPQAGDVLLERLAATIRAHEQEGRPYRLSMSYALTWLDWNAEPSLDDLLADADRKMYQRKRARTGTSSPVVRPVRPPES